MFFWNMEKHWRKEAAFPRKNRKPCWRQYLRICRKATAHRCSRSWDLWDCKIEKIRRIFQRGNTPYLFTGKADPVAEAPPPENSRRKSVLPGFSVVSLFVFGAQRVRGSLVFHHTYHLLSLLYAAVRKFFHFFCTDRGFYVMIKKIEKTEVEMIGVYEKGTTGTELPHIGVP